MARVSRIAVAVLLVALLGCAPSKRPFTAPPIDMVRERQFAYEHNIELFKVKDGMIVAVVPDDNTNLVQVDMRYRVGAAEDPKGKEGLAHLVEHIMFELRSDSSLPTLTDRLRDNALSHNASTTFDATNYTATGTSKNLRALLEIERDRIASDCSMVSDDLLKREREVVRQEIAWRGAENRTLRDVLREQFFAEGHAYHNKVSGSDASVAGLTRADVCTFMERHYGSDQAILVVSGDVSTASVRSIVGPLFGSVSTKSKGKRTVLPKLEFKGSSSKHKLAIEDSGVAIAFPYPVWGATGYVHADLLTDILYAELSSLEGKKHLESVHMGLIGGKRSRAIAFILTPDKPENRDSMVNLFFKVRKKVLQHQTKRFFINRRVRKRASMVQVLEPFRARASRVADYLQYTDHLWFMIRDMTDLQQLLLKDLKLYEKQYFLRSQSHIAYFDPTEESEDGHEGVASLDTPTVELDIQPWRSAIDAKEADGPLKVDSNLVRPMTIRFSLDNGLKVILAPEFEYPTVDMRLVFSVGDDMDPPDKPGLAFWSARLLDVEMDDNWKAHIWNRVIHVNEMGGNMSAWTTGRSTVFRNRGLSMYTDGLLWKLHWLVESGTVAKNLKHMKKLLRKARKEHDDSDEESGNTAQEAYTNALLKGVFGPGHPYAVNRELLSVLLKLKGPDLESFRNSHYGAQNATLIVAGNFNPVEVRAAIKRQFESWPTTKGVTTKLSIPDPRKRAAPVHTLIVDSDYRHPEITVAFSAGRGLLENRAARLVIEAMLEGRMKSVREKLGASYGVSVDYEFNEGPGIIVIRGTVNRDKGPAALAQIMDNLKILRAGEDIRDDFSRARRKVLRTALADTVNATTIASQLVSQVSYELPADYADRLASAIANLTLEEAKAQLAQDLAANKEVLIIRGTKAVGKKMFEGSGITKYKTVP